MEFQGVPWSFGECNPVRDLFLWFHREGPPLQIKAISCMAPPPNPCQRQRLKANGYSLQEQIIRHMCEFARSPPCFPAQNPVIIEQDTWSFWCWSVAGWVRSDSTATSMHPDSSHSGRLGKVGHEQIKLARQRKMNWMVYCTMSPLFKCLMCGQSIERSTKVFWKRKGHLLCSTCRDRIEHEEGNPNDDKTPLKPRWSPSEQQFSWKRLSTGGLAVARQHWGPPEHSRETSQHRRLRTDRSNDQQLFWSRRLRSDLLTLDWQTITNVNAARHCRMTWGARCGVEEKSPVKWLMTLASTLINTSNNWPVSIRLDDWLSSGLLQDGFALFVRHGDDHCSVVKSKDWTIVQWIKPMGLIMLLVCNFAIRQPAWSWTR